MVHISVVLGLFVTVAAAVFRLYGWIAPWNRLCFLSPTSASSSHKSPSCEFTIPQSGTSKAARSMTSFCALKISSVR